MPYLIDFSYDVNKYSSMIYDESHLSKGGQLLVSKKSSYDLLCERNYKTDLFDSPPCYSESINSEILEDKVKYSPPLLPDDPRFCMVSSFGYTHETVNGESVERKNGPDWFIKGYGSTLVTSGQTLRSPWHGLTGDLEIEFVCVYFIDHINHVHHIGYTLAIDFSDSLLRNTYPNLANLSKLRSTAICQKLVLGDIPEIAETHVTVMRGESIVWDRGGHLGSKQMFFPNQNWS